MSRWHGSTSTTALHVVAADGGLPALSPDSKRIAYARYIPASDDSVQIRVVNADGTG